ncbi:MAG: PepSY domain-containing protein, partial [Angustibacter sp.]
FHDPGREKTVHVDRFGGQIVAEYGYPQYSALAKTVAQGIAVHEGRRFGLANLVWTTLFCLAVVTLCVTGPVMWWRRRPRGSTSVGAPRGRMPLATTPALTSLVIALGLLLPLFGLSLLLVLAVDRWGIRRWSRARAALDVS